jgi:ADP-heptose:LPS heptosyltransferase
MIRFMDAMEGNGNGADSGKGERHRVLVVFPGALGDLICLAPTLNALARRHRDAQLELMAREELARFAVGRLGVARAHSIDRREVSHLFRSGGGEPGEEARRFFGSFERIYSFFSAGDLGFRSALEKAAGGQPVTFHRFRPAGAGHVAEAYLREIGDDSGPVEPGLSLFAADLESAARRLRGPTGAGKFIAIFPGSGSPAKNWPPERFAALARLLAEESRALFVLGPAEAGLEQKLCGAHPVVGGLPLGTVAALARFASAFVGVDSGVSHLAAAAGTPGVVLFGPTEPARWRPLGRVEVLRRNPIEMIEPAEVLAALRRLRMV